MAGNGRRPRRGNEPNFPLRRLDEDMDPEYPAMWEWLVNAHGGPNVNVHGAPPVINVPQVGPQPIIIISDDEESLGEGRVYSRQGSQEQQIPNFADEEVNSPGMNPSKNREKKKVTRGRCSAWVNPLKKHHKDDNDEVGPSGGGAPRARVQPPRHCK